MSARNLLAAVETQSLTDAAIEAKDIRNGSRSPGANFQLSDAIRAN
jgi:hypothetical protein